MMRWLVCGCSWDDADAAWVPCAAHAKSSLDKVRKAQAEIVTEAPWCWTCGATIGSVNPCPVCGEPRAHV